MNTKSNPLPLANYFVQTVANYQVSAKKDAMQKLNLQSVVQRDPDVIAAEAGEDVVMVSIDKGQYYAVSGIAREIWQTIERPKPVSDLIGDLVANYNVDRTLCEKETLLFLEELLAERLLQVRNGSSS